MKFGEQIDRKAPPAGNMSEEYPIWLRKSDVTWPASRHVIQVPWIEGILLIEP